MSVIARKHGGSAVAMACGSCQHIFDPTLAEAMAARVAVELGQTLGMQNSFLREMLQRW